MKFLFLLLLLSTEAYANALPTDRPFIPPAGAAGLCDKYTWACATHEGRSATLDEVKKVNREVNRARPITDALQHGVDEYWSTLSKKGGDCEDYALTKKQKLVMLGVDPKTLLMATVLDKNKQVHAVLVWRTANGDFVLDNLTNQVLLWNNTGYTFISIQNPNRPEQWARLIE